MSRQMNEFEKAGLENFNQQLENWINEVKNSIVETPSSRESLENFAEANGGSLDMLLMQKSIQFGYQIALEKVRELVAS